MSLQAWPIGSSVHLSRRRALQRGFALAQGDAENAVRAFVNLIEDGDELIAAEVKFIDTAGSDPLQVAPLHAPLDDPFHRAAHRLPTGVEDERGFLPARPPSPSGEEEFVAGGERAVALGPGHVLGLHALAAGAIDPAHPVAEKDFEAPERNEFEVASFGRIGVVTRRKLAVAAAARFAVFARLDFDDDAFACVGVRIENQVFEDEGLEFF